MLSTTLLLAATALLAIAIIAATALMGWQGWLALKSRELDRANPENIPAQSRIELADLKERIRKLEAIAAGVDL
jgi:hypothetical protein